MRAHRVVSVVCFVQEIACACLFLAGKVEERRIRVDQVVSAFFVEKEADEKKWAIASGVGFAPRPRPVLDSHDWEALRQRIYEHEALLLDAVEYNFDVVHPYTFLRLFLKNYIYSSVYCKEGRKHSTLTRLWTLSVVACSHSSYSVCVLVSCVQTTSLCLVIFTIQAV